MYESRKPFFELVPKRVPADKETIVEIRSLFDHVHFTSDRQYEVAYYPAEEISHQSGWPEQHRKRLKVVDSILRMLQYFAGEQEHILFVEEVWETTDGRWVNFGSTIPVRQSDAVDLSRRNPQFG